MRAIMVMFDSLNRRMLEPYGCDWVKTPNFARLAKKSVTFDSCFVGSMPCMPARRELHTGRYNFLHRSWGPLEPFDDSMPRILKENGIFSHLASDHYHYWEDGGATYHNAYSSWEAFRGQEGDFMKCVVADPDIPETVARGKGANKSWRQDWINRNHFIKEEKDFPQAQTFAAGLSFLEMNKDQDDWFLHIETFDPHEPYYSPKKYKDQYPSDYKGRHFDWPAYGEVNESPEEVDECRRNSAALHTMCDEHLGKVLDFMDQNDMWKDTMLIVNTDHGFLLGEHDWWAKCRMPFWNQVANTPFFIWDPRCGKSGQRRKSLVQTIDIAPTVLEFFGLDLPEDMQGVPLRETVACDQPVREAGLFGIHGGHVNVTDGRHVYMRAPVREDNSPLYNYTLMPTHMNRPFPPEEFDGVELAPSFKFTKNCKTLKTNACGQGGWAGAHGFGTLLYDIEADYEQKESLKDPAMEKIMIGHLLREMKKNDAPAEQFERLGLKE
jgi:arylsulfatase A-like enzyme